MSEGIHLSVIIVNFNTLDLVLDCLRSLYKATESVSKEVFVVDNGSTDGSAEGIRSAFPRVILIQNERNLGFARASNMALGRARGRYLLLLNTDVVLEADTVNVLMGFMDKTPAAAIAGAQLLNRDRTLQNSVDNFPTLLSEGFNKSLLRVLFPGRFPSKRCSFTSPTEVESVIGACMMARQEAVASIGPLDEDYFFFMEETDWCWRVRARGWAVFLVPQARAVHLQGATADKMKGEAKLEYYRSRYHFFAKHWGGGKTWALRIILLSKLLFNTGLSGLICLLVLFQSESACRRAAINWKLLVWHFRLCPDGGGLKETGW
jgi:GT2 family glycosyltransferase